MRRLFLLLCLVVGCGPAATTGTPPKVADATPVPRPTVSAAPVSTPPVPKKEPAPPKPAEAPISATLDQIYDDYQNPIKADPKYLDKIVSLTLPEFDKTWKDGGKYYVGFRWQLVGELGEPLSQDADCLSYVWELSADGAKQFAALPDKASVTITGRCKGARPARGIGNLTHQIFFADCGVKQAAD